ncbi:MAG: T9SS type A sorting domain-containing protein, partial [Syntrophothermus sp.]
NNWIKQVSGTQRTLMGVSFTDINTGTVVGSYGVILRTTNGGVTFINETKNTTRPGEFILLQNFPNPFNPTTTISYSIPKHSYVELKICDVLGREVSTLVNDQKHAGEHKVQFDGSSLPSGVYIYTIQAGSYRDSKKLLLLK